jgi:hypothetical protein
MGQQANQGFKQDEGVRQRAASIASELGWKGEAAVSRRVSEATDHKYV